MTTASEEADWQRLRALFDELSPLAAAPRESHIHEVCNGDAALERELRALLAAHDRERDRTGETRAALLDHGLEALTTPIATGERIGPWRLLEVLGRGGMGVVYRAERADGAVQQLAAVKVLSRMHLDEGGIRRFAQERDIVAQLVHPGIARLYDAGTTADGFPYYAMELVDGQRITEWCDLRKLGVDDRVELFLKVCEAVRFAHANLVLHRDIKPANVLVDAAGEPRLIDFGIAKAMNAIDVTQTGLQLFSPSNAAPEQVRGERCGVACDVYQLGTVLYELLAGRTVLGSNDTSPAAIETAILHQVPMRPSEVLARKGDAAARRVRGDLDAIVLRALRKEPGQRYASVEQLAQELRHFLRDEPIVARRGETRYRVAKFLRRHALGVSIAAVAVTTVAIFVAVLLVQSGRLAAERDAARLERNRARASSEFLVEVFTSADPGRSLGRTAPIGEVLDRGREQLAGKLAHEPGLRASLSGTLAEVYETLGDPETAAELLAEGDAALAGSTAVDDRSRADFLVSKIAVLGHRGDIDTLDALAREAIALQERLGDSFSRQYRARNAALRTVLQRTDVSEWKPVLLAFLHGVESDPTADPLLVAQARALVGHNLTFAGEYEDAERLIRQAIPVLEAAYPAGHANVVSAHYGLGYMLARSGRAAEAVPILEQSHRDGVAAYGENSFQVARHDIRLGEALLGAGRYEEAERVMLRTLRTLATLHTPPHGDLVVAETGLGALYVEMHRWADAELHLREALRQSEALGGGNQPLEMRTQLGAAIAAQGRLVEALAMLDSGERFASPRGATFVRWAVERADVLHRLGRDDDARAALARAEPLLAANARQLSPVLDRATQLRVKLGGAAAR